MKVLIDEYNMAGELANEEHVSIEVKDGKVYLDYGWQHLAVDHYQLLTALRTFGNA